MNLDQSKIAEFLKNAINDLVNTDYTCTWYDLDKDLAIFVGWTEGCEPDDVGYIHSKNDPTFIIAAKIASTHEYMKTDLDWLVQPYYEDGEVWDTEITLTENSNFEEDAKWFIDSYKEIRKALDNGELLLENKKLVKEVLSSNDINKRIKYDFEEAYKDWGYDLADTKQEFIDRFIDEGFYAMDSFIYDDIDWRKYLKVIPELESYYEKYKDVDDWEIEDDDKVAIRKLIAEYTRSYLESEYKSEESITFEEIISLMENADDFSELRQAAEEIVNPGLREDVQRLIDDCEEDCTVEEAYSILTTDLLDDKVFLKNTVDMEELLEEAKFKDKVKAIKKSLKKNDKRISDKTAQQSAEKIAGAMIKNEGWNPDTDVYVKLMKEIQDNLGIDRYEMQKEGNSIKFRYNGKVYYAEPRSTCQVDIFDDNHKQIGYGVVTDKVKQEVFTDYITNQDYIYQLVGGEYAGTYTREEAEKLPIKEPEPSEDASDLRNSGGLVHRKELDNQLQFKGYLGPMWNGTKDGKAVIRYETQEVYDMLSENKEIKTEVKPKNKKQWYGYVLIGEYTDKDGVRHTDEISHAFNTEYLKHYVEEHKKELNKYEDIYIKDTDVNEITTTDGIINKDKRISVKEESKEDPDIRSEEMLQDSGSFGLNRLKELTEDEEIIDRPEDLIEDSEEDKAIHHNEDGSEKTILDYLEDRVGQELEAGRLNAILQSIFGMYNRTFILPTDLYNMDLDYTQTLTIDDDGEEYNIYYDIVDVDSGVVKIVDVEVV